jgi:uncharacterized protein (TIGR02145 family)
MSSNFWQDGDVAGNVNSFTLESGIFSLLATQADAKLCNYYQLGNDIVVETIAQYLERMITGSRPVGTLITVLVPKIGYAPQTTYPIAEFGLALANFDVKQYHFVAGLEDVNFVEIITQFTYYAYASDNIGTDFTTNKLSKLPYEAKLITNTEILTPAVTDFAGLWRGVKHNETTDKDGGDPENNYFGHLTQAQVAALHPAVTIASASADKASIDGNQVLTINKQVVTPADIQTGTKVEYGALYNWYAATDARNIAASGFHVPTEAEREILSNYLGGSTIAGGKLKETGLIHWDSPNIGADNSSGFNGVGSGIRGITDFSVIKKQGYIWMINDSWDYFYMEAGHAGIIRLQYNSGELHGLASQSKKYGSPIRVLADSGSPTSYTGNDGKVYKTVTIGTQTWLAENLNETKYRNGNWIHGFDNGVYTPITNAAWGALITEGMCYYGDLVSNGGGETPLTYILDNLQHPALKTLDWLNSGHTGTANKVAGFDGDGKAELKQLGTISTKDFWTGTLAAYTAISPKDSNTIYHVEE